MQTIFPQQTVSLSLERKLAKMEDSNRSQFSLFLQLSKPYLLIIGLTQSVLGAGMARYLGNSIDWLLFWFGMLWVLTVQLGVSYLHQYFDLYVDVDRESGTWFFGGSQVLGTGEGKLPRRTALIAAMGALGSAGAFTVMIFWQQVELLNTMILMLLILFAGLTYALPPLKLSRSGYGEMLIALTAGFLVPAFGFELQAGSIHRLVTQTSLPIVLIIMPVMIALSFPGHSTDLKKNRPNLLIEDWLG